MKQACKIYNRGFKGKAVQLSFERHNISALKRESGVTAPSYINGEKSNLG
jgi:transposase